MNLIDLISSHVGDTGRLERQAGNAEYSLPISRRQGPGAPPRAVTADPPSLFLSFPRQPLSLGFPPWNLPSTGRHPVQLDTLDLF